MDFAARLGHLDIVQFLHENRTEGCTIDAMQRTMDNGYLDVLVFLDANRSEGFGAYKMDDSTIFIKHMEVGQWMHEKNSDTVDVQRLISRSGSYMPELLTHILG